MKATGDMPISISAMRVEVKNQTKQFCEADVVPHLLFKCVEQEKNAHDESRQLELGHLVSGTLPQKEIDFIFLTVKRSISSSVLLVKNSGTNVNI